MIAAAGYIGYEYYKAAESRSENAAIKDIISTPKGELSDNSSEEEDNTFTAESFSRLKDENADFVGYLEWNADYGLPVVQTANNGDYLRLSFYKKYSEQGVPYMDAICRENDDNLTIYGHNVYYDDSAMFSPVASMMNQDAYDKLKNFTMYRENGAHYYQAIYVYALTQEEYQTYDYAKTEFEDPHVFNEWRKVAEEKNTVNNGGETIKFGDKLLTLSTCKRWDPDSRILVVCRETGFQPY